MSSTTLEKPKEGVVTLVGPNGEHDQIDYVPGMLLGEYFDISAIVAPPISGSGEGVMIDGFPAKLDDPVEPSALVNVGPFTKNG